MSHENIPFEEKLAFVKTLKKVIDAHQVYLAAKKKALAEYKKEVNK